MALSLDGVRVSNLNSSVEVPRLKAGCYALPCHQKANETKAFCLRRVMRRSSDFIDRRSKDPRPFTV